MTTETARLVLASGSATRRALLEGAGLAFEVVPADVDEAALRDRLVAENASVSHESVAQALADAKAAEVSTRLPDALVIGADQVLSFEGTLFEKPKSMDEARAHLRHLRGKPHALHAATAIAFGGAVQWRNLKTARLTFRAFGDAALEAYLARAGTAVLTSVGAYQIEGPAIQLFECVDGSHSTILGLPLLPLLAELRRRGAIAS